MTSPVPSVTLVTGLPRSGTSLMMRMLEAGGMPVLVDGVRRADEDNPYGYYEYDPVRRTRDDSSWVNVAQGSAVKIVYKLLYDLPSHHRYDVLMMRRRLPEVVVSQNTMLKRLGQEIGSSTDEQRLVELFSAEMSKILRWLSQQPNFSVLEVDYNRLLAEPHPLLNAIAAFLGRSLDVDAMCRCIDPSLYRKRR